MKLWDKGVAADDLMEAFTVGEDRDMDVRLARWDVVGSIAHATMLGEVGLLEADESKTLVDALSVLLEEIETNGFVIEDGVEDVHSQVEKILTERLGDVGKKIHLGRSRNDQVAVDMKMFLRHESRQIRASCLDLAEVLLTLAETHRDLLLPGYTHYQVAMPSSFGLWLGGFVEALLEDVRVIDMAIDAANANPLGSAAGFGTSLPLDRETTTRALNFDRMHVTSTFAQMSRGRTEKLVAMAIAQAASTLSRFAADVVLYMGQNHGFISLPDSFTTGSSIMPHKKNPDVFEVLRGRCNRLQSLPNEIALLLTNLPTGYHRDVQFLKDRIIPAIDEFGLCLQVATHTVPHITPTENIMNDEMYRYAFSVDRVNELVNGGLPFRDAYKQVGAEIENGSFEGPEEVLSSAKSKAAIGSPQNPGLEILRGRFQDARMGKASM